MVSGAESTEQEAVRMRLRQGWLRGALNMHHVDKKPRKGSEILPLDHRQGAVRGGSPRKRMPSGETGKVE